MKQLLTSIIAAAAVVLSASAARGQSIAAGSLSATFEQGRIVSLRNQSGRELLQPSDATLFTVGFVPKSSPGDKVIWLPASDAKTVTSAMVDNRLEITYSDFTDYPGLAVTCVISAAGDDLRWDLRATTPNNLIVLNFNYPVLNLAFDDEAKSVALQGSTKGGLFTPALMKEGGSSRVRQPGNLAAQFSAQLYTKDMFYTMTPDPAAWPKSNHLLRQSNAWRWFWNIHCTLEGGDWSNPYPILTRSWQTPDGRDITWHDAAELYKTWAKKQYWCRQTFLERDNIPAWLKQGPTLIRFHRDWLAKPEMISEWVRTTWKKEFADTHLIVALWGWEKVHTWITPDYFPVFPDNERFAAMTSAIRPLNAHPFPWPSGYHWTLSFNKRTDGSFEWVDQERFDQRARKYAIHNIDGTLYERRAGWLRGGVNACMCPGEEWTRRWWNEEICRPLVKLGCDIIQVDQVVGGNFPACYHPDHAHPKGYGRWMTDVFTDQLKSMYKTMAEDIANPVVCIEEPNEVFNHLVGLQDYRNCQVDYPWASVFNYIYHEYLPCFQSNPRHGDIVWQAFCAADGQIPHINARKPSADGMLLDNGGFELSTETLIQPGWEKVDGYKGVTWDGAADIVSEGVHSGQQALRLDTTPDQIVQVSRNININQDTFVANGQYRLSAWLKTERHQEPNHIGFALFAPGLGSTGVGGSLIFPAPEEGWVLRQQEFTIPEGAEMIRIMINTRNDSRTYVDDVRLEARQPDGSWQDVASSRLATSQQFQQNWVRAYRDYSAWLQHGEMLPPPKLDCETTNYQRWQPPVIFHNRFRAANGEEAVVLVNATKSAQVGTLHWQGKATPINLQADEIRVIAAKDIR